MLKKVAVIVALLTMTACSSQGGMVTRPNVVVHPELPRPVFAPQFEWSIIEHEDDYYIGTQFKNFTNLLKYEQDVLRYMKQSKNALCSYRVDLDEEYCKLEYSNEEE